MFCFSLFITFDKVQSVFEEKYTLKCSLFFFLVQVLSCLTWTGFLGNLSKRKEVSQDEELTQL